MIRSVCLLLTAGCNFECSYCYQQKPEKNLQIDGTVWRRAIDALLEWCPENPDLGFSGGEPFLAPELLKECIEYADDWNESIRIAVTTNGSLLDGEMLDFLVDHEVNLRISCDGDRQAQDLRQHGSFEVLDRLFDTIRSAYPDYWMERVAVGPTLTVGSIPYLARSVEYFMNKGVERVVFHPEFTWQVWDSDSEIQFTDQVQKVVDLSISHWRKTRKVPVSFMKKRAAITPESIRPPIACSACSGTGLTVDRDGRAWGCQLFASSLQDLPLAGRLVSEAVDLGDIRDPAIEDRISRLAEKGLGVPALLATDRKYSSHGRCRDCSNLPWCHVCPVSTIHIPGNDDGLRVADFPCAYNRITLDAADRFAEQISLGPLLDAMADLKGPIRRLEAFLPPVS